MKIVFINVCDYVNIASSSYPLGILSLATVIKESGEYEVEVIDFNRIYTEQGVDISDDLNENIMNDTNYILKYNPDFVSLYTMCNSHHIAILLAKQIKSQNPKVKVLFGGPHASLTAEATLKKFDFIDAIGIGEGENTILEILRAVNSSDFTDVRGIGYRQNGEILCIDNDNLISDMDQMPIIDFDLYKHNLDKGISLDVGRGCPFGCSFCSTKTFWKRKFRIKSAVRIFHEITTYIEKYDVYEFNFQHDLFLVNRNVVLELCDMIIQNNIKISWYCSSRIDTIDEEMINKMYLAGCKSIFFGIETGSERMQKLINKNLNLGSLDNLVTLLKKYNITPTFSFIYGFPDETEKDIDETLSILYYLYSYFYEDFKGRNITLNLSKLIFFPGTEITNRYIDELHYIGNYHTDARLSIGRWNSEILNKLIRDKQIFPQYFDLPTKLRNELRNLDIVFNCIFIHTIMYINETYRLVLDSMNNSNLKVYYAFTEVVSESEILNCHIYNYNNLKEYILDVMKLIKRFVNTYEFGENTEAIRNIFAFEENIFLFSTINNDYEEVVEYDYDVISMKKNRLINPIRNNIKVKFLKSDNSASVYKVK
ncbi:radical SAM protein [Tissierella sp. MB52-C2]|uniref:B12-binding domain-containing radical SAM protein n=1 Tax=Tissierella sp. MB52-C2 TaxID=3070999 RepID=UPI00280AEDE1|nr:radical SAM protein [Tissierella sp. MB52-C2]WMM25674.1 radical SAM protein [Tissierella sp. MB52-C2]